MSAFDVWNQDYRKLSECTGWTYLAEFQVCSSGDQAGRLDCCWKICEDASLKSRSLILRGPAPAAIQASGSATGDKSGLQGSSPSGSDKSTKEYTGSLQQTEHPGEETTHDTEPTLSAGLFIEQLHQI